MGPLEAREMATGLSENSASKTDFGSIIWEEGDSKIVEEVVAFDTETGNQGCFPDLCSEGKAIKDFWTTWAIHSTITMKPIILREKYMLE